jgi:hypothetical protein
LDNALRWQSHTLTLVIDGDIYRPVIGADTTIVNVTSQGASAARNIGASSIPKYRRQDRVMFVDDDIYAMPGWDSRLFSSQDLVVSGHAHPYNVPLAEYRLPTIGTIQAAGVLSTVHMTMMWEIWDDVGFFVEPGGAGGSEDVEWCKRAVNKGYGLAVTEPQCIMHTGLTSSVGDPIVGYDLMVAQNEKLREHYHVQAVWQ